MYGHIMSNELSGEASPIEPVEAPTLGLRKSDRLVLLILSAMIVLLILTHLVRQAWKGVPAIEVVRLSHDSLGFQVDINRATWVEWMQLPEIGETTARQIIADRQSKGPFHSIDEVSRVKGIGLVTMEKIRPYLRLSEGT